MKRRSETQPLNKAFKEMLSSYKIERKYKEMKIVNHWERIMGKPIANRTSKIYIKDGTLFVQITSAPLKKELSMGKSKILDLLEKEMDEKVVEDIYFL